MSDRKFGSKKTAASTFSNSSLVSPTTPTLANPVQSFGLPTNNVAATEVSTDLQEAQSADEQLLEQQAIPEKPVTHDISCISLRRPQAKLTVGEPGDRYEQEADMIANTVMSMPALTVQREEILEEEDPAKLLNTSIQREISPEEEELQTKSTLQTASDRSLEGGDRLENQLNGSKGGGSPLADDVRSFMEPRFGADFSQVRVHTNSQAVQMNQELGAQAFTHGNDVYYGQGKAPGNNELTAHELTHVVQQTGSVQSRINRYLATPNFTLNTSETPQIQRDGQGNNLERLNEMLDKFNVPEEDVIKLCGQLTAPEKATVLAGGYRSRMIAALNVSEMVQALNNLNPPLSTKLEWLEATTTFGSRQLDYSTIQPWITAAPQAEKDALKINYWKNFFVNVCTNQTMVTALNDLGFDLITKLTWLQAEMTVTSLELDYATIKPWITAAPQTEKDALKTDTWKNFFVNVCTNETMITALNDLGFDLQTKLNWLQAEMTITSWELSYTTIQPWITAAPQGERDVLKTDAWKNFFVKVCTNQTMITAVNDLGFDLITKLTWLDAEMTITRLELDYATIKPWITAAPQTEKDALKTDTWKNFFVKVCTNDTMVDAVVDLNFDLTTKLTWLLAEGIGNAAIAFITSQGSGDIFTALAGLDEAQITQLRRNSDLIDAFQKLMTNAEFAQLAANLVLITPSTVVDRVNARNEALRILTVQLNNKDIARSTINGNMQVVIIPRDKLLTDVAQFADLAGTKTFDGRPWEKVRGVGHGNYVAVTEENLLGGNCTATFGGNPVSGTYTKGYSTTSHEFAHGLHDNSLTDADRQIITNAYNARKALATASPTDPNQWVDGREGCYASQTDHEFFAQLSNAYLGTNTGNDANTGDPRHNGKAWVQTHEPTVFALLDRMYAGGSIPNANP
ncbi:MAG: DUF4157 domain-containing protein [Desmonostoc geniculatum HA4340-LM1]|nr:DUF4157 domain-containing protein [Desmonostoc geniculatum HA4340-LM1]